jgi:hypothetical protein
MLTRPSAALTLALTWTAQTLMDAPAEFTMGWCVF